MRPLPNRSGTMPGAAMKKMKPAGIAEIHSLAGDGLFPDEPAPSPDGLPTDCERLTVRTVYSIVASIILPKGLKVSLEIHRSHL